MVESSKLMLRPVQNCKWKLNCGRKLIDKFYGYKKVVKVFRDIAKICLYIKFDQNRSSRFVVKSISSGSKKTH